MKKTLTTSEAADLLKQDEYAGWSYDGACALIEYLEQLEDEIGEPIEFDRVAIRCDYSEYASALEAAQQYDFDAKDVDTDGMNAEEAAGAVEASALEYLEDHTTVIPFDNGVIIQNF